MIKLKSLLIEEEAPRILIPRNLEKRKEDLKRIHWRRVLKYIKDGSQGDLDLRKTPLEYLPDDLIEVGGDLYLNYSKIKKLPDNLKEIKGSLYLTNTSIEYLPENLIRVDRHLYLSESKIKTLPDNLKIGINLFLRDTPINQLPRTLSIGLNLFICNTPLSLKHTEDEIRKMVKHIGGKIYT
jgi:hypothetical protein